jgi:hypothetical protein
VSDSERTSDSTTDDTATGASPASESDAAVDARSHGIEVFSAPSDAPRVRWLTDLISAGSRFFETDDDAWTSLERCPPAHPAAA